MSDTGVPWIVLARVVRPQGRKGEVLAELLTDFPGSLAGRAGLHLGHEDRPEAARPCEVTAAWLPTGRNEGRVVLAIAGIATIGEAETLAGFDLMIPPEARLALEDDSMYVSDLEGSVVYDGEQMLGRIAEVQFPVTADGRRLDAAAPLLLVQRANESGTPEDEVLVPFVKEFLVRVDREARALYMRLPEGLADLAK